MQTAAHMGADDSQSGGKRPRVTAADFMGTKAPDPIGRRRVSPMEPYLDDLLALRSAGYSDKQLLEFLSINGVVVMQQSLSSYLLRHGADRKVVRARKGAGSPQPAAPPPAPRAPAKTELPASGSGGAQGASDQREKTAKGHGTIRDQHGPTAQKFMRAAADRAAGAILGEDKDDDP